MSAAVPAPAHVSRRRPGRVVAAAVAGLVALAAAACTSAPVVQPCVRRDLGSLGPENDFALTVAAKGAATLRLPAERVDVAFTVVPPLVGPVTLVQTIDGTEGRRWELTLRDPVGISTRCSIGFSPATSTCGSTLGQPPHPASGRWSLDPGGNHVLEAGLSLRECQ